MVKRYKFVLHFFVRKFAKIGVQCIYEFSMQMFIQRIDQLRTWEALIWEVIYENDLPVVIIRHVKFNNTYLIFLEHINRITLLIISTSNSDMLIEILGSHIINIILLSFDHLSPLPYTIYMYIYVCMCMCICHTHTLVHKRSKGERQ